MSEHRELTLILVGGSLRSQSVHAAVLATASDLAPNDLKNLLDWTVGGGSLNRKPAGWINPCPQGRAQESYRTLRIVLDRAGAYMIDEACVTVPMETDAVSAHGVIADARIRATIDLALSKLPVAARSTGRPDRASGLCGAHNDNPASVSFPGTRLPVGPGP